jgi:hypothetical protein
MCGGKCIPMRGKSHEKKKKNFKETTKTRKYGRENAETHTVLI